MQLVQKMKQNVHSPFILNRKFYFYRIKQAFTSGVVNIVKQCPNSGKSA